MKFDLDKIMFSIVCLTVLILCICIGGCAAVSQTELTVANTASQGVAQNAEDVICKLLPVGTWMQRYGTDQAKASAWNTLCNGPTVAPVAGK